MTRDYHSYLLRCWWRPDGTQRVAIEHVQTGERDDAESFDAALAWINRQRTPSQPAQYLPQRNDDTVVETVAQVEGGDGDEAPISGPATGRRPPASGPRLGEV